MYRIGSFRLTSYENFTDFPWKCDSHMWTSRCRNRMFLLFILSIHIYKSSIASCTLIRWVCWKKWTHTRNITRFFPSRITNRLQSRNVIISKQTKKNINEQRTNHLHADSSQYLSYMAIRISTFDAEGKKTVDSYHRIGHRLSFARGWTRRSFSNCTWRILYIIELSDFANVLIFMRVTRRRRHYSVRWWRNC